MSIRCYTALILIFNEVDLPFFSDHYLQNNPYFCACADRMSPIAPHRCVTASVEQG